MKQKLNYLAVFLLVSVIGVTVYSLQRPKDLERSLGATVGDIDGNNSVDSDDFDLLKNTFGRSDGQTGYDTRADFDVSRDVNILDFQLLSNNYGTTGQGTATPTPIDPIPTSPPGSGYDLGAFRPGLIPIEVQAHLNSSPNSLKSFGHEHVLCWLPLGKKVTDVFPDGIIRTNCRVTLDNNPSSVLRLVFHLAPGNEILRIPLNRLTCPHNGNTQSSCSWNVPVSINTNIWPQGWRHLRIRAVQDTPSGEIWTTSSEVPMQIGDSSDGEFENCRSNGTTACFRGKSWYPGLEFENVEISGVPLTEVKRGTTLTLSQRKVVGTSQNINVLLDNSHLIAAVNPWPEEKQMSGVDLSKPGTNYSVSVDTSNLSTGWHSYTASSTSTQSVDLSCGARCSYAVTNPNYQTGVAKFWFYVTP